MDGCIWYITITKGIEQWRICLEIVSILGFWAYAVFFSCFFPHFFSLQGGGVGGLLWCLRYPRFTLPTTHGPNGNILMQTLKQYPPNYKLKQIIPQHGHQSDIPCFRRENWEMPVTLLRRNDGSNKKLRQRLTLASLRTKKVPHSCIFFPWKTIEDLLQATLIGFNW